MRKRFWWLGIGIATGTAISDSATALIIGIALAAGPYLIWAWLHIGDIINHVFWKEINGQHVPKWKKPNRPAELDAFEYQHYYDTGELPKRWRDYDIA